jgi:hypothetical protein
MAKPPEHLAHQEWLGFVQPVGLVVSVPALLQAQAYVNRNIGPDHARFLASLSGGGDGDDAKPYALDDFSAFARAVLGWEPADLVGSPGADPLPASLEVVLPEYHETLRPTYAVREFKPKDPARPWLMLVQVLPAGIAFDEDAAADDARHWQASPQAKFERLLREAQIPVGLLVSPAAVRLVYAPRGETSGHATFGVAAMASVAGRPIFAALHLLLSAERLFTLPDKQRLPAILADSRKYQNTVSTQLAEQVLAALYELVRGFQAADDARRGELLKAVLAADPNHVYAGLLTVLMRLVFVLFAEDRGLLSADPLYANHYSVTGLFDRLRADTGRYPDTMGQRYGAWAQLLTLFRLVYDGGHHGGFKLPARRGYLFDPDRYPFLEGRGVVPPAAGSGREPGQPIDVPRVSDGVVYAVLSNLLVLDGERLNYRSLDVQHIGSVYEAMMGFDLHVAAGRSIAIKPAKSHGAPASVNLDELLTVKPGDRAKWVAERTDQKLAGQAAEALKKADTIDALLAALEKKVAKRVTESVVPAGAMVLQPSDERRRSGSHYTPRSLTEPIVAKTLEPIFARLSEKGPPTPQQVLDLKVCDPAMGSGAFLVEACQQLGDALVKAWHVHGKLPADIPPDEDPVLHARRLVAQRCVYGVDRNPMAVDLAKLSLWLATLARDHPFTFLDHSLRHGDSLVGLTLRQVGEFHWKPAKQLALGQQYVQDCVRDATSFRQEILAAGDHVSHEQKRQKLEAADDRLDGVRFFGDLVIAAFFGSEKDKERIERRHQLLGRVSEYLRTMNLMQRPGDALNALGHGARAIRPFHWEIEFPEVFGRENRGFDAIVGNPPFLGGPQLTESFGSPAYQEWLKEYNERAFGNADLSAYFFRRAFSIMKPCGALGFVATNSISEGGTRTTGLQYILSAGGNIYNATRSLRWPGEAAVFVAVVHVAAKELSFKGRPILDDRPVQSIDSRLRDGPELPDPVPLVANDLFAFMGAGLGSSGFILTPAEYATLSTDQNNRDCLMPYLGGEEVNQSPTQAHERYAVNFRSMTVEQAMQYPSLLEIVKARVKPDRDRAKDHGPGKHGKKYWWQYTLRADPLYERISPLSRCLVAAINTSHLCFSFQPIRQTFAHTVVVFAVERYAPFACLQSQPHFLWSKLLSSSLKDDLRYSVSGALQTFPFPADFLVASDLERAGEECYEQRAALMIQNNEGLTKTYNRFHDPAEASADINRLRHLHAEMDRAVLDAYRWPDLRPACGFGLDYLDLEDNDDADLSDDRPATLWWPTAAEALAFAARLPDAGGRRRRLPWRHRWADDVRDEVLAQLLALNQERAEAERLAGIAAGEGCKGKSRGGRKAKPAADEWTLQSSPPVQGMLPGIADDSGAATTQGEEP